MTITFKANCPIVHEITCKALQEVCSCLCVSEPAKTSTGSTSPVEGLEHAHTSAVTLRGSWMPTSCQSLQI